MENFQIFKMNFQKVCSLKSTDINMTVGSTELKTDLQEIS